MNRSGLLRLQLRRVSLFVCDDEKSLEYKHLAKLSVGFFCNFFANVTGELLFISKNYAFSTCHRTQNASLENAKRKMQNAK